MPLFGSRFRSNSSSSSSNNNNNNNNNNLTPTSSSKSIGSIHNIASGAAHLASYSNNNHGQNVPIKLSINIESPPIMLYGTHSESTGSILSGLLKLEISDDSDNLVSTKSDNSISSVISGHSISASASALSLHRTRDGGGNIVSGNGNSFITIHSVKLSLIQTIQYGKPFLPPSNTLASCDNCRKWTNELARWDVLTQPTEFAKDSEHGYPFSHLIPGSLPATTSLSNFNNIINYELVCTAVYNNTNSNNGGSSLVVNSKKNNKTEVINIRLPIVIKRSILRGPDRNSLRVFPPTEVTASAVLPNVVYPKSSFPIELKMNNVSSNGRRWRMRKLNWRLEESIKTRAHSCDQHKFKLKVLEEHTRKMNLHSKAANTTPKTTTSHSNINSSSVLSAQVSAPPPQPTDSSSSSQQHDPNPAELTASESTSENQNTLEHAHPNALDELLNNDEHVPPSNQQGGITEGSPQLPGDQQQQQQQVKHSLYLEETRTISHGDVKSGWKSDFSGKGSIELVAEISLMNLATIGLSASLNSLNHISSANAKHPIFNIKNLLSNIQSNCSCDMYDDTLGVYVSHMLIVEVVVAEELLHPGVVSSHHASNNSLKPVKSKLSKERDNRLAEISPAYARTSPQPAPSDSNNQAEDHASSAMEGDSGSSSNSNVVGIPTGSARVLRMQFRIVLTERSGLGIAWDDEVPPTYQDVRALSPPSYNQSVSNLPQLLSGENGDMSVLIQHPSPAHTRSFTNVPGNTPGVLYGIGETPGVNSVRRGVTIDNLDHFDENFEELNL
ncbi:hypothetical protein PACTADRAFT_81239 [Pachysolen tannophilus NRRL Y-2460]|uniref:LDB19 N-terminal domain-containing protein n=1 Tax=Pachysolen tannophilus NRRL Y-2460 TaxID=669874 RepID=A0A1E4TSG7_PACTA|nr:hypothetical protein PACTADRAFT_81239 [Pachysolen tannophilus NRRL Y-2460]